MRALGGPRELRDAKAATGKAAARCMEIDLSADDLRVALPIAKVKNEVAAESARERLNRLREENASLRGQITTLKEQYSSVTRADRVNTVTGAPR